MIREVPTREWGSFLEQFDREHRAWLATVHDVDARGTVTRSALIPLKSVAASADAVKLEFLGEARSVCVHSPTTLRIQEADIGLVQALEIETSRGQFMRLAFRATALPEQLDGLAPGELTADPFLAACHGAASLATNSSGPTNCHARMAGSLQRCHSGADREDAT
jgi:hypothetical protein